MPRCNLTLKQKCQIIELCGDLSTDQLAKKFRVHPTTVTRTVKNKDKILDQASRVNVNFKTVQTNQRGEEHDTMILEYIRARQASNEPLTIKEICDKAVECARTLGRNIKSQRGWWRRFKLRCNIIKSKLQVQKATSGPRLEESPTENDKDKGKEKGSERKSLAKKSPSKNKKKNYTFKVRDSAVHIITLSNNTSSSIITNLTPIDPATLTTTTTLTNASPIVDATDTVASVNDQTQDSIVTKAELPVQTDLYEAVA